MNTESTTQIEVIDLATSERVDNLAALVTVTSEQLDDRIAAGEAIEANDHRTAELIELVFGSETPSVESYLSSRTLQAA